MGLNLERKNQFQRTSLIDTTVYDGEMMFNQLRKKETYKNLVNQITENLQNSKDSKFTFELNGTQYDITVSLPDETKGINIPSMLMMPRNCKQNTNIVLESNNMESSDLHEIISQAGQTGMHLTSVLKNNPRPILIPILPSEENRPYFQQLSQECFNLSEKDKYYRIDKQIVRILEKTKEQINQNYGINCEDKILLNGYSSSGVFAQRFSMIHPEIIKKACIGGASGSIPLLDATLDYPIGIKNYRELFGKDFDMEEYKKIQFEYYVGELETINKSNDRRLENGELAPMHDMSYFDRSVPINVGIRQRKLLGYDMFERVQRTISKLKEKGVHINHQILKSRTHRNMEVNGTQYKGVNELGDKIIDDTFGISREKTENKEIID